VSSSSGTATAREPGKRGTLSPHTVLALVILVFVDAHDAATPLPAALARAAEEALGSDAAVSIRTLQDDPPAAALVETGRAEHATAVARITWTDAQRSQARLDVASTDGGPARNSTIAFTASDPLAERGRAIGLVLAALLAPENRARLERAKTALTVAAPPAVVASVPAPPAPARHFALDAAAEGGFAIGGVASRAGGTLGLRWQPGARVGLRVGAQARFGEVSVAEATATELAATAGLVLFVIPPADERRFALALRADALLIYELLSHLSPDDAEAVRGGHLLPGADVLVEGQLAVSPTLALVVGGGAEVAFGRTDVFVHQEKVAEIAPFRLVLTGGLVARF
jgi:hypothetical protein